MRMHLGYSLRRARLCPAPRCTLQVLAPVGVVKDSGVTLWEGGKRLQVLATPVADDTLTIRSLDWDRDRFDIEFGLQVR